MALLSTQSPLSDPSSPAWDLPVGLKWLAWPGRIIRQLLGPKTRNVSAWILAVGIAIGYPQYAWYCNGYTSCDFAGQWLMGRMFITNNAHNLYLPPDERPILHSGYSGKTREDLDWQLLSKGHPDPAKVAVEGPLYPPTAGLLFAPLAVLPPEPAFAVASVLYVQLAFAIGWFFKLITRGRLRTGEGALLTLLFPNIAVAVVLGQNSMLTLAILTAGWLLMTRGWHFLGGMTWALLAYKPVFAAAIILVPILLWRWRMVLGMAVGGAIYVAATLPFLLPPEDLYLWAWNEERQNWDWVMDGERLEKAIEPWLRWREVGAHAAWMYTYDRNWVWMSRDLTGLPRRAMWDWEHLRPLVRYSLGIDDWNAGAMQQVLDEDEMKLREHDRLQPFCIGLLIAVGSITALLHVVTAWQIWRRGRSPTVAMVLPRDAFLLFGTLFTTFHFMHYDLAMFALPTVLLIDNAARRAWWSRDRGLEIVLGLVLLVCFVLLLSACYAARFVEAPANYSPATVATSSASTAGSSHASTPSTVTSPSTDTQPATRPSSTVPSRSSAAATTTVSWSPPRELPTAIRWAYFAFSGICLAIFLVAWGWAGYLGSWLFDAVWGVLLFWSTIDLGWTGGAIRLPFETFLFLLAWAWAGSLMWREARILIRR